MIFTKAKEICIIKLCELTNRRKPEIQRKDFVIDFLDLGLISRKKRGRREEERERALFTYNHFQFKTRYICYFNLEQRGHHEKLAPPSWRYQIFPRSYISTQPLCIYPYSFHRITQPCISKTIAVQNSGYIQRREFSRQYKNTRRYRNSVIVFRELLLRRALRTIRALPVLEMRTTIK